MKTETENEIIATLEGLNNKDIAKEVEVERVRRPDERLRLSLFNLIEKQALEIQNYDSIIQLGLKELRKQLEKSELSVSEVLSIINTLSNKKVDIAQTIFEPFKATPNASNPLLPPVNETTFGNNDFEEGLSELTAEERRLFDSFYQKMASLVKKSEDK